MFNNPLAAALGSSLMPGEFPQHPDEMPTPPKMSKGQIIAGIIADALAGAAGQPGPYAAMMRERRRAEDEDVRWSRRREADLADYMKKRQIDQQMPEMSPMERDAATWQRMSPEQKAAYQAMKQATAGDQFVTTTLPNGQFYAGPRSGLIPALTGGGGVPVKPVGKLTPIAGGPTPPASGGFPY